METQGCLPLTPEPISSTADRNKLRPPSREAANTLNNVQQSPERLERSFKILKGEGRITEINIAETLKDVRRALLDADVNYKVAKTFTDTVKQKALGQNVINAPAKGADGQDRS